MPRKTRIHDGQTQGVLDASMRPRPDAAENDQFGAERPRQSQRFNEAAARCRGKRGGFDAARTRRRRFNEAAARCRGKPAARRAAVRSAPGASMRPRPDAAENLRQLKHYPRLDLLASMRPRPDAAENTPAEVMERLRISSFNEAAARCRGKR